MPLTGFRPRPPNVEPQSRVAPHLPDALWTGRDQPESPHSFLVCIVSFSAYHALASAQCELQDPGDNVASRRALDYAKLRLARAGDLVVLCTVIPHPLMTSAALPS